MSNRAIHDLPAFEWDGMTAPCSVVDTTWSHRYVEREYYQVDGSSHEPTGRTPITTTLTLHFHNTIEPDLYPARWAKFRKSFLSGETKKFKHPEIGIFDARPQAPSYKLTAQEQSGTTVQITFVETIKAADQPTKIKYAGDAKTAAQKADKEIAELDLGYPDGMPDPNLEESVAGLTGQISLVGFELNGKVTALIGTVDRIKDNLRLQCELVRNAEAKTKEAVAGVPARILLELQLDTLRFILSETAKNLASTARVISTFQTKVDQSLGGISFDLGADLAGILDLNPTLLGKPLVPKGTTIRYFG